MEQMIGKQSLKFTNAPYIIETACIAGKKEGEGPLGKLFDKVCEDGMFGKNTWEEAESELQKETIALALSKASYTPSDMRYIFAGDLLGQLIASSFGVKDYNIPFFGVYGACSTMTESMSIGAMLVDGEFANTTDSDNTDIFYQLRGIGALVGNVNTTLELADVLNLSTNKLSNVKVTANFEAFTFVKLKDNDVKELHILVGAGGNRAVGTLEELINSNTYENNLSFVTLPTRVEGDYTYTDSSKPAQSETPDAGEEAA